MDKGTGNAAAPIRALRHSVCCNRESPEIWTSGAFPTTAQQRAGGGFSARKLAAPHQTLSALRGRKSDVVENAAQGSVQAGLDRPGRWDPRTGGTTGRRFRRGGSQRHFPRRGNKFKDGARRKKLQLLNRGRRLLILFRLLSRFDQRTDPTRMLTVEGHRTRLTDRRR